MLGLLVAEFASSARARPSLFGNVGDPHLLYGSRLPLRRIATEDEIGRVALFLASDLSAIMTGSVVAADAGDLAV